MKIDRVVDNVYVFVSELYAQVVCTGIITPEGAIVVDALPFPSETRQVISFLEGRCRTGGLRYLILTHYHADHTYGAYLFDTALCLAQHGSRAVLERFGEASLARAKQESPALAEVELRLPDGCFGEELHLHLGDVHLQILHTPGHTADGCSVFYVDERILVAGDAMMPVPQIVNGDPEALKRSLERLRELRPNFVVQGHGDVLLRGEVNDAIGESISYLDSIASRVAQLIARREPESALKAIDIESCGKSRIPLDGLVSQMHAQNLVALYRRMSGRRRPG